MNSKIFFSILLFLACWACINNKEQPIKHRSIFNCDGTDLLGNHMFNRRPLSLADVNAYVDSYANTQVTTFMMCSGSDYTYYRSKYGRVLGDDRNGTLNCGKDTAMYRNLHDYFRNHLNLEKEGTDVVRAALQRAKRNKMETFITYRMNDLHFNDTTSRCPVEYTDFWLAHPQYWINEDCGWKSRGALNFSYKEVREQKLNMITEQIDKYGELIDGYELDFMRFPIYFKNDSGTINAPLMTELVTAVKVKLDELSAKRGRKILLSVRVLSDVDFCLKMGLDVKEWMRLGLLDFVTASIFFNGDIAIPVAKFKSDMGETSIPVYASIENGGYSPRQAFSHGIYRGMASHILAQGADGVYLFNYFIDEYFSTYKSNLHLEDGGYVCKVIAPGLLNEMGLLETLRKRNKIVGLDDGGSGAYGFKSKSPLPLVCPKGEQVAASIFVGDDVSQDVPEEAILFLRANRAANFELSVNDTKVDQQKPEYVRLFDRAQNLHQDEVVSAFIVPATCLKHGDNIITVRSLTDFSFSIKRVELALKYGDVKTNGYF
ncbi:MAG: hypothetical protein AB2L20_00550 [Mangrovibacterium sp.]